MSVNYTKLILGQNIQYNDHVKIHVPTIYELSEKPEGEFASYVKPFAVSVRELFSGAPEAVDKIEDQYPTLWEMAFDDEANMQVGQMLGDGKIFSLRDLIISGIAYWTETKAEDFKALLNSKIVCEKLDWVIDKEEFLEFSEHIRMITLSFPNEDLIAPRGMTPPQMKVWESLYKGRVRKLQRAKGVSLGDKILILQASTESFIPWEEIGKMTYYQFSNLMKAYAEKEGSQREFDIYVSPKFDAEKMKINDWRSKVSLIKK